MTHKGLSTSRGNAALLFAIASCLFLISLPVPAQDDTEIAKVMLTVRDWANTKPTAGLLYRSYAARRTHVADISEEGKIDRPVRCKKGEKFEAQAESALDRPIAPVQLPCNGTLAFQFTRMFVTTYPADYSLPLVAEGAKARVFSTYAEVFADVGNEAAASAWSDAAILSAASSMGDKKYDKLVYRDATAGSKIKFTEAGIAALKSEQNKFGILETGTLDEATQGIFAKRIDSTTGGWASEVPQLRCQKGAKGIYVCAPSKETNAVNKASTVFLPELKF